MRFFKLTVMMVLLAAMAGCIRSFEPEIGEITGLDKQLVVVEGDIIVGGFTYVKLGLSKPVSEWWGENIAGDVAVWVESADGQVWNGSEYYEGADTSDYRLYGAQYMVDTRSLPLDGEYRLCVSIPDRGEYVSEFKPVLVSPPIDSLWYEINEERSKVAINLSAHDDINDTGYYRWQFQETWNNRAIVNTKLKYNMSTGKIESRPYNEVHDGEICYTTQISGSIVLENTENLNVNMVSGKIFQEIGKDDKKLLDTYCISVVQMVMDKVGYVYWEQMKKNTFGNGGLFAPQPSEVGGNIVNSTNPSEYVIGYVNVCKVSHAKMYVDWRKERLFDKKQCDDWVLRPESEWADAANAGWVPLEIVYEESDSDKDGGSVIKKALWVRRSCTDTGYNCQPKPEDWPFVY